MIRRRNHRGDPLTSMLHELRPALTAAVGGSVRHRRRAHTGTPTRRAPHHPDHFPVVHDGGSTAIVLDAPQPRQHPRARFTLVALRRLAIAWQQLGDGWCVRSNRPTTSATREGDPMPKLLSRVVWSVALTCVGASLAPAWSQGLTVGVVKDGPSIEDELVLRIEAELRTMLPAGSSIRFKSDPAFDAGWDHARAETVLRNALRDPETDVVLLVGALVLEQAARPDVQLTKPVVSTLDQRVDMLDIPRSPEGRSRKRNLSFLLIPGDAVRAISQLQDWTPFETLHVAIEKLWADNLAVLQTGLQAFEDSLGVALRVLPVADDADAALAGVGSDVKLVALGDTPRLQTSERRRFIEGLTQRGVATISLKGHEDVELGAVVAWSPNLDRNVARRVALNIHQISRGVPVDSLPVFLSESSQLLVNARTMTDLGYPISTRLQAFASFTDVLEEEAPTLTLAQVYQEASVGNLTLQVTTEDVEVARQEANISRSFMLPQINTRATYRDIDPRGLEGILPRRTADVGFQVDQMIYDDEVVSGYRANKRLEEGARFEREAVRQDVAAQAGVLFMQFVQARALNRVEADNVELTRENLELAKLRFDVGYSGRDEVFRWEAELANRRSTLFDSQSNLESSRIVLNQFVGGDQSRRWIPEEVTVSPDTFPFLGGRLDEIWDNADLWNRFREVAVQIALENSPEVAAVETGVSAQTIILNQAKRRYFLPKFTAQFQYDYDYWRDPDVDIPRDLYQLRLGAFYPLFEGGRRVHEVGQFSAGLRGLQHEQQLTRDLVERRTRTALRLIEASFPRIDFKETASENAFKNLELVQDKYTQGIVNVTDLLEAQNQNFTSTQAAVASVYVFLSDLIDFQRSLSWLEEEKTQQEKDEMVDRIRTQIGAP
ncbi:MAG: TolC family protein [Candidatus Latescibacterota bacterium]|nr:MAG: TolC family protein [Candidatus Latescibacterota bacterium]